MRWTHLGHACWHVENKGLRLLFDPVIDGRHHGGVFDVWPPRIIDTKALKPDFLFVSHRHPDHFDVPSLARLAKLDPDTVVLSPDWLVLQTASRLGFRQVHELPQGQRVDLDQLTLVTTPSLAPDPEWGAIVLNENTAVWNQVDTVIAGPKEVRNLLTKIAHELNRDDISQAMTLALIRWQPLVEIAAQMGDRTAFPLKEYSDLLDQADATQACSLALSSSGAVHCDHWANMNSLVYPVPPERAINDLVRRNKSRAVFHPKAGDCFLVEGKQTIPQQSVDWVELIAPTNHPRYQSWYAQSQLYYRPFEVASIPRQIPNEEYTATQRNEVASWVQGPLLRALQENSPHFGADEPVVFLVEVLSNDLVEHFTLTVSPERCVAEKKLTHNYDLLNAITGSILHRVLRGEMCWGDALLSGAMRSSFRAYRDTPNGLAQLSIAPFFFYYAISYEESQVRSVDYEVKRIMS